MGMLLLAAKGGARFPFRETGGVGEGGSSAKKPELTPKQETKKAVPVSIRACTKLLRP